MYAIEYNNIMKKLEVFKLENGKVPLYIWLDPLDKVIQARIDNRLKRLQAGNFGEYKRLGNELNELKLRFGSGYRVYYSEIDDIILLLLCGGDKRTQDSDIKKAKEYLQIWRQNNEKFS